MDRRLAFVAAAIVSTLVGCAGQQWYKPGASEYQARQAYAKCDYEAELATASQPFWATAVANQVSLIEKCMTMQGYVRGSASTAATMRSMPSASPMDEAQCLMPGGFVRFMPPLYCERAGGKPHIGP